MSSKHKNKKNSSISLKGIFKKINLVYVFYIVIIIIFIANYGYRTNAEVDEEDAAMTCGDYGCDCSNCQCGEIAEEDAAATATPTATPSTSATATPSTEACSQVYTATGSTSGEFFYYSYNIRACSAMSVSVYLKGSAVSTSTSGSAIASTASGTLYLYTSQPIASGESFSGGAMRPVSEGYTKVCLHNGVSETCSS